MSHEPTNDGVYPHPPPLEAAGGLGEVAEGPGASCVDSQEVFVNWFALLNPKLGYEYRPVTQ
jgi:hypothetical protein